MARKSSKEAILDAAERVIRRQGLAGATIEAVAQEAGVSKGGLFYHFASKKEMLLRLVERYGEQFEATRAEIMETLPDTPVRLLKATILASIAHPAKMTGSLSNLLSLLDDVDLRRRISDLKQASFRELTAGAKSPEKIAIAILAVDGLWLADIFGSECYNRDFRQKVVDELLRLIDHHGEDVVSDSAGAAVRRMVGEG